MNLHDLMIRADPFLKTPRGIATATLRAGSPAEQGIGMPEPPGAFERDLAGLLTEGAVRLAQEPASLLCAGVLGLLLILRPRRRKR